MVAAFARTRVSGPASMEETSEVFGDFGSLFSAANAESLGPRSGEHSDFPVRHEFCENLGPPTKIPLTTGFLPVRSKGCQTAPLGVSVESPPSDDDELRPPPCGVGDGVSSGSGRSLRSLRRPMRGLAEGVEACGNAGQQYACGRGDSGKPSAASFPGARALPVSRSQLPSGSSVSRPRARGGVEYSN